MYGKLFFLNKFDSTRPIEEKYVVEIDGLARKSFVSREEALLFLFDSGIRTFQNFTKEICTYINTKAIPTYELWHVENRVGFVLYDYEPYIDENNNVQKREAYVWRFVGFGKPCFAATEDELNEKVLKLISEYKDDPENRGLN